MLQIAECRSGLRGEVLGRDALPVLLPHWQDLCGRAAEDNVYYSPRYALALMEGPERNTDVRFAVVWDQMRLVALLPFTRPKLPVPGVWASGRAWRSKYTFSCMPLLDEVRREEAAGALLDALASVTEGGWAIPSVNVRCMPARH